MKKLNLSGIGQQLSKNQMKKVVGGYLPGGYLYCEAWQQCFYYSSSVGTGGEGGCNDYGEPYGYYGTTGAFWDWCNNNPNYSPCH